MRGRRIYSFDQKYILAVSRLTKDKIICTLKKYQNNIYSKL